MLRVHPCFCGGFADRTDPATVVIRPGYLDGHWTKASWTATGVRDKVGATRLPLPGLVHALLDALQDRPIRRVPNRRRRTHTTNTDRRVSETGIVAGLVIPGCC
jgi:hypothetical protein